MSSDCATQSLRPSTSRRWLRLFVGFGTAVIVGLVFLVLLEPGEIEHAPTVGVASLEVPAEIDAGTIVSVQVSSEDAFGEAHVHVANGFGRMSFVVAIANGTGRVDLPAALTQQAGAVSVMAGDLRETLTIAPGEADEVIAPLVGPRTIVADGNDVTLAVVLPVDRYGNQVANGTPVAIEWHQPAPGAEPDVVTNVDLVTVDGMVSALLPSGRVAGPTTIRTVASAPNGTTVNAAAVRIDEVPGTVASISLNVAEPVGTADGRSLVEIETTELTDRYGNVLADGTLGQFVFDGPSGEGIVPGTVQNGIVRIELVAPDMPGTLTGHLELHGKASNTVAIEYASAIGHFDAHLTTVGGDTILRIQSALDVDGGFVADGTEVRWGTLSTQIRLGEAELRIPTVLVPDTVPMVEILGLEKEPMDGRS